MNRILSLIFGCAYIASLPLASAASPAIGKPEQVEIECKLIQLSASAAKTLGLQSADGEQAPLQPALFPAASMIELLKAPSVPINILSAPRVVTKDGLRAVIEIIRELRSPKAFGADERGKLVATDWETNHIGITLEFEPKIREDGKVDAEFRANISYFDGWAAYKDGKTTVIGQGGAFPAGGFALPIISRTGINSEVTLRSDETHLLGGYPSLYSGDVPNLAGADPIANLMKEPERQRGEPLLQFLFVTLRTLDKNGNPISGKVSPPADSITDLLNAPVQSTSPIPANSSIPYGTHSGRAGFVKSPFAPTQGYVDVRGFPRNIEVKCPYTGKVFLVP